MKLDMHFHSTASDGLLTQEELLKRAKEQDLEFIALTDHDVVSYGFREEAKKYGIKSCQSVEISAYNEAHDKSLHLTFYAKEISQDIGNILQWVVRAKEDLIWLQLARFQEYGFEIDADGFYDFFEKLWRKKDALNKFDMVVFVFLNEKNRIHAQQLHAGNAITREDFYLQYLKRWWDKFHEFAVMVPNYEIPLSVCRDFAQKCDAIISIPHPNVTFKKWGIQEFEKVLPHYIEQAWVNAIEVNACATRDWVEAILQAKEKYDLFLTFWSDFHKSGINDGKHWDFWQSNPFLSPQSLEKYFQEYSHKIYSE